MTTKFVNVPPIAADILGRATVQGNVIILPPGKLDRPVYTAVNKALEAMGGAWNRKVGGHVFPTDPSKALAAALTVGVERVPDRKQTLQFFETPEPLAERMAELVGIKHGDLVLEPSAGHGRLVKPLLDRGARVVTVEIDPENSEVLRGLDVIGVHLSDFLLWGKRQHRMGSRFDAVAMNPPFSGNQDIRHIRAAWELLRDGGRLVAIVSEHPFLGGERDCIDFRLWLNTIGADAEALPPSTFASSGTTVRTRLITATKAAAAAAA
ncbi:putative RNA methylase [Azospirillum agricola]|uniref:hypothetical protein n=1 Tax=Azospirillum agricola TaxID=1720247 RepID=UPI001AE963BE|nr:hypothetical protein [Azospirillum agricola]MBP2232475.1 putative RNA methylase [Azospirillum agricola]